MTRTRFGLMVRAAAANPDKARLVGISVFADVDARVGDLGRVHRRRRSSSSPPCSS